MPIRPRLGFLSAQEAELMLRGLVAVNRRQLREGWRPVGPALHRTPRGRRLRYIRTDPDETWLSVRDIWRRGGGDCEDLAAAVAAEMQERGLPARVRVVRIRPGLMHAVVGINGVLIDPSRTGGMGAP